MAQPLTLLVVQLSKQSRHFHHMHGVLNNKNTSNASRQGKIMGKLFGNRVAGSKKRWIPSAADGTSSNTSGIVLKGSQFGKAPNSGNKNSTRRVTVLNKLFMKHITDLMGTGEISVGLLGKGLQVSRVKLSQDFAYVNVFWLTTGEVLKDNMLEIELKRCSGLLRHELSQLGLMGEVPRINFTKEKHFTNIAQVEALLRDMDFGHGEEVGSFDYSKPQHAFALNEDFYNNRDTPPVTSDAKVIGNQNNFEKLKVPQMRHDVLGLDHKSIMLKIFTKMRKSKQAWEQHLQMQGNLKISTKEEQPCSTTPSQSLGKKDRISNKSSKTAESSEKFEAFLAKRREKKNTPDRKKYRQDEHQVDMAAPECNDHGLELSSRQKLRYEAEDYWFEGFEERKT